MDLLTGGGIPARAACGFAGTASVGKREELRWLDPEAEGANRHLAVQMILTCESIWVNPEVSKIMGILD
jgi:hypothetical protein